MSTPAVLSNLVGGSFVPGEGLTRQSLNPSSPDEVIAKLPVSTEADVSQAVFAAADALPAWRNLPGPARAEHLYAWAERIAARTDEIALAMANEVGKPIGEARGEVGRSVAILRYFAGEAVRPTGSVIPAQVPNALQYAVRQPLGVVGLITPWNFPFAIPLWKAAPALAVGNTVVLKPSEESSFCADLLAQTSMGMPDGVFNVVHGDGSTGQSLVSNQLVKAMSFTGSVKTGMAVQVACASRNAKVQCEMGGKNAAVVLADADLARAAGLVAGGAMRFAGQKCTATSRVIVHHRVYDAFVAQLIKAIEALPIGSVTEASTAIGPVINSASHERLTKVLSTEKSRVLYTALGTTPGCFVKPTLIGPVGSGDLVAQDELFGPVVAVLRAEDFDHAIEMANSTSFGLSTAVYTKDVTSALTYIDRIEAGLVRINGDTTGVDLHAPFGGMKASSSGTREQGEVAKDFYTEWKTVQINA